jgi:hypothetical protein
MEAVIDGGKSPTEKDQIAVKRARHREEWRTEMLPFEVEVVKHREE